MSSTNSTDKSLDGGSNDILKKLTTALRSDGDFPVRAKIVTELRSLANNPNTSVGQITEIILKEPSLGTRVLHLVNSAFYQRTQAIMTVTQAVVQLGMRTLSELCAGLVIMQKFVPEARRGGIFADNVKRSILTSLITSYLAGENGEEGGAERGYLAGTFFSIGPLLLAFYYPQVYEKAATRAKARKHEISQSISEILGLSPIELNLSIVDALEIPEYYRSIVVEAHQVFDDNVETDPGPNSFLANKLAIAGKLAETIVHGETREDLEKTVEELKETKQISEEAVNSLIEHLPAIFGEHCSLIEMDFLSLPAYILNYKGEKESKNADSLQESDTSGQFSLFVDEIRQAVEAGESVSSVITSVMESLAFGLKFDRVLLLLADPGREWLVGRMALGNFEGMDPKEIRRSLANPEDPESPDITAFEGNSPLIFGDPVFDDAWPFAALPIGYGENSLGVVYADKINETQPLGSGAQAALSILTDLLDQSVKANN